MGTNALLGIGVKTMAAAYAGMQVTGHNIANANVEGYSRQKVELATAQGQFTGAGFFGKGVDLVTVKRAFNGFLTHEAVQARSVAEMDSAKLGMLSQLERLFKPGEAGLGQATGQFLNSMVDLASRPSDSATREVVLARAQEMATRFSDAGRQLTTMQVNLSADVISQVTEINQLAKNIAEANEKVALVSGVGQTPNDLLDERDRLISHLNRLIQVTTIPAQDGTVSVFVGSGQRLVLASRAGQLQTMADQDDPTRIAVGFIEGSVRRAINPSEMTGGSVAGLLRFQNKDLVDGRNLLGRLAVAVTGAVNTQQQLGINLYKPFGAVASEPMFAVGGPRVVPHAANQLDALGMPIGTAALTITHPELLKASEYKLEADPAGTPGVWQLTRLSDGNVRSISSGDEVDGFRVDIGIPAPALGDRFLLQPVAQAASGVKLLLDDVRDLAAASPLVATAVPTPTGTVSIDSMRMLTVPTFPDHTVSIRFTDDAGHYQWDLMDPAGTVVSSSLGSWQAGSPIPTPPVDMNGFTLKLLGVPRLGDQVVIKPADPNNFTQNNGNAIALSGLRDELIVDGATATDAYSHAMADVGVRVQGARSTSLITTSLSEAAETARSSDTGVSLDEEAARLIQYQQSYQAAARVLQIAQKLVETLLATAGG